MPHISLKAMLQARENRMMAQHALSKRYGLALVSFTMNIPGPEKNNDEILTAFLHGLSLIRTRLDIVYDAVSLLDTGCEALLAVRGDALTIKRTCVAIEDADDLGRLFDMDVLDKNANKISREAAGFSNRICLLCNQNAHECSRSRAHTVDALLAHAMSIMRESRYRMKAQAIAQTAQQSLLFEVAATPKPGLVDRMDSGSHEDMDIFTFMSVIPALYPYFYQCAKIGMTFASDPPSNMFPALTEQGLRAEQSMFRQSNGVNTHKGAIFSMGLVCASAGRLYALNRSFTAQSALRICSQISADSVNTFFEKLNCHNAVTVGETLYVREGLRGVRGEAASGFPVVLNTGLPVLRRAISDGLPLNDAACVTLLHIMAKEPDTVLIGRSSYAYWQSLSKSLSDMLEHTHYPSSAILSEMNRKFVSLNLSPGGCADLLSVTLFVYLSETYGSGQEQSSC